MLVFTLLLFVAFCFIFANLFYLFLFKHLGFFWQLFSYLWPPATFWLKPKIKQKAVGANKAANNKQHFVICSFLG
jgi:hypothetical protein